jgi:hypothetical protein
MRRFLLVVFPDEARAFRGFHALGELHRRGSVFVCAAALVARDDDGALSVRKRCHAVPLGAGLGALVAARSELLEVVARELAPGAVAVVAEVWEAWTTRLDEPMEPYGGRVVCEWWTTVTDDALERRTRRNGALAQRSTEPQVSTRGRARRS